MIGAAHHGERPGGERSEEGDLVRMAAQDFFCEAHHDVQAAGGLQDRGATEHRHDGEQHIDRGLAGGQVEDKGENQHTDAADQAESEATVAGTRQQAEQDDHEFHDNVYIHLYDPLY